MRVKAGATDPPRRRFKPRTRRRLPGLGIGRSVPRRARDETDSRSSRGQGAKPRRHRCGVPTSPDRKLEHAEHSCSPPWAEWRAGELKPRYGAGRGVLMTRSNRQLREPQRDHCERGIRTSRRIPGTRWTWPRCRDPPPDPLRHRRPGMPREALVVGAGARRRGGRRDGVRRGPLTRIARSTRRSSCPRRVRRADADLKRPRAVEDSTMRQRRRFVPLQSTCRRRGLRARWPR